MLIGNPILSAVARRVRRALEPLDRDTILLDVAVADRAELAIDNAQRRTDDELPELDELSNALHRALCEI